MCDLYGFCGAKPSTRTSLPLLCLMWGWFSVSFLVSHSLTLTKFQIKPNQNVTANSVFSHPILNTIVVKKTVLVNFAAAEKQHDSKTDHEKYWLFSVIKKNTKESNDRFVKTQKFIKKPFVLPHDQELHLCVMVD